ncbi:TALPID3-like isoform X2, partial [Brachionus plicatilis]
MVDGCINAISNDVKKAVNQKMIDDSKHIKLEAERDTASKRPSRVSSQRTSNQPAGPKPKQISNVHKYLGKIYGKSVLDQIKMDEVEEKNRRFREEAEQCKKKISIDKTKKIQPASQKVQSRPSRIKPVEPVMQRPAFISIPVQPYPENQIKNFDQIHRADNIGMVTILPREKSPSKAFNITRQVLPSMSINPARSSSGEKKANFKQIEIKVEEDENENDQEVDEEETGLGINVLGSRKEEKEAAKEDVPVPLPGDLSADRQQFLTDRNLSENRVLDWLEQEILKNFLLRLQVGQESEDESRVDNFRLLVDVGQDIDPDLIECLTREVLNEKIAAMIDRQDEETLSEVVDQPPVASIRKSVEFLEKKKEKSEFIEVSTPKVTPPLSPITVENFEPQPAKKESEIQLIQFINDEETESVLEI